MAPAMDEPVVHKLFRPVQFGEETIAELTIRPSAKSMRDLALPMKGDGTMLYEPYALAKVAVHMAGQPNAVLDMLHPTDVMTLSTVVMDFLGVGPGTGSKP